MGQSLTAQDVLDELDEDARTRAAFFPDFGHGYNFHVDARLTAYSDGFRWVITIEQLTVNPRSGVFGGIATDIYYHGNAISLPPQPGWEDHPVQSIAVVENGPGGPLLTADYSEEVNPGATDVRIRGQVISIRTDENYYWARKLDTDRITHEQLDEWIQGAREHLPPDRATEQVRWYEENLRPKVGRFELRTWHFARGLVPEHRQLLLATEAERRLGVPAELPMLIQLDDWYHPDLLAGELPRGSDSFKQIARVIAQKDRKLCRCTGGNVHWSNWPTSGSL